MKVKSESEVAQSYPTLSDPWTAAYQAPLSMGFSRQEYWSEVPLPSPVCVCACVCVCIYICINTHMHVCKHTCACKSIPKQVYKKSGIPEEEKEGVWSS